MSSGNDVVSKLRDIRTRQNIQIAPSPYLQNEYEDEYGDKKPVILRDYQKSGILNLLLCEKFILGDDTGLGKTLQVLSAIGYVWMKEPSYVPLIITTKSALFQWEDECRKFMKDMEPVVVHGEPYEREKIYNQFFSNSGKKQLLLMTYDTLFRDIDKSVIKDRGVKVDSSVKKQLKETRAKERDIKSRIEAFTGALKDITNGRNFEDEEYVFARIHGKDTKRPHNWDDTEEKLLNDLISARANLKEIQSEVMRLDEIVAPSIQIPGLLERIGGMDQNWAGAKLMFILDEIHKLKNHKGQIHEKARLISGLSGRIIGMTATPVQNRLMEFFSLFRIIQPTLFPKVTHFQNEFCVTKLQRIGGGRQIPIVVGYRNLENFVSKVEPYYLSRKKYDVAKELPSLISVEVQCELNELQDELYDMAEADVINSDEDDTANALTSLTMCQQAADSPELILNDEGIPFEGPSSKVEALLDLLEGQASGCKVIVFSKYEKMISSVEKTLQKNKISCARITGKESDPKYRQAVRQKFQDPKSGIDVILITTAGSESINLQAAEHFVFLDLPWSWGVYVQLTGRMVRIGSIHTTVVAHHFLAKRIDGSKTIDHHVLKALRSKKNLADKVAGESLKDGLTFSALPDGDSIHDILNSIRQGKKTPGVVTTSGVKSKKPASKAKEPKAKVPNPITDDEKISHVSLDLSDI